MGNEISYDLDVLKNKIENKCSLIARKGIYAVVFNALKLYVMYSGLYGFIK